MKLHFCAVVVLTIAVMARAGDKESITWADLPGVDGKTHSLSDLNDKDVVVVAITRNRCPVAVSYFQKMNELAGRDRAVALVAINLEEVDDLDGMKDVARERGFKFPYLRDSSQEVGRRLGATVTPEFFVLNKDREVVYRGAWDDGLPAGKVVHRYVETAVKAARAGKAPAVTATKAAGCAIDYRGLR
jgi:peroxiredoxin